MRKYDKSAWPVLWISDQLHAANDVGAWSRKIVDNLEEEQGCAVITSSAYGDAHEIKPTFMCPGIDVNGTFREDMGIPAAIVTNHLIDQGIVCEKTDYYTWLLLNSPGTTKGKQGTLVAELFKFKALYDGNAPLKDVFPSLMAKYPDKYEQKGLKEHCGDMHRYIREKDLVGKMNNAFDTIPEHGKVTPAKAYQQVVKNNMELVRIQDIDPTIQTRRAAPRSCWSPIPRASP